MLLRFSVRLFACSSLLARSCWRQLALSLKYCCPPVPGSVCGLVAPKIGVDTFNRDVGIGEFCWISSEKAFAFIQLMRLRRERAVESLHVVRRLSVGELKLAW